MPGRELAQSPLLEYQRTAAAALASFTLSVENKAALLRQGGLTTILILALYKDLQVVRDSVFALANLADALDLQSDLVREGAIETLAKVGEADDARVPFSWRD